MFHRAKKNKTTIASTKEELREAIEREDPCIEVQGELAKKLRWIAKLSMVKKTKLLSVLEASKASDWRAGSLQTMVVTITGAEIAALIFAAGVSAALILAILKGYDAEVITDEGKIKIILKNKTMM